MEVGSLVVIKPLGQGARELSFVTWLPIDDEKTIYTLREADGCGGWRLEEGVIGWDYDFEIGIKQAWLREIQPPMDVEAIVEDAIYQLV